MKITVSKPFTLTLPDQSKHPFGVGVHEVPDEVGTHWFAQAHCQQQPVAGAAEGEPVLLGDQRFEQLWQEIAERDRLDEEARSRREAEQAAHEDRMRLEREDHNSFMLRERAEIERQLAAIKEGEQALAAERAEFQKQQEAAAQRQADSGKDAAASVASANKGGKTK